MLENLIFGDEKQHLTIKMIECHQNHLRYSSWPNLSKKKPNASQVMVLKDISSEG